MEDILVRTWLDVCRKNISDSLYLTKGTENQPLLGQAQLSGLVERIFWPSTLNITDFEGEIFC
jgi:hypothetical protein